MFGTGGLLGQARNFEFRPEQQQMAVAVARALGDRRHLVVEAGTGVGKSLAYLAPAVMHALETRSKAVVSTHTINLQEQLIFKDIPILQKLLDTEFEAALFKGRQNYLCPRRLTRALQQANELFTGPEQSALEQIHYWSLRTADGSLSDLPREPEHNVWSQVCSEAHVCTPKSCGTDSGCFYQEARRKVNAAQIVVLNHALFFVLLGAAMAEQHAKAAADVENEQADEDERPHGGFLFEDDFVIFDEAHTVEAVAAKQIGLTVSQYGLRTALQRLYHPRTKKGLWTVLRHAEGVRATTELIEDVEAFFARVDERVEFKRGGRECRIREPELVPDTLGPGLDRLRELVAEAADEGQGRRHHPGGTGRPRPAAARGARRRGHVHRPERGKPGLLGRAHRQDREQPEPARRAHRPVGNLVRTDLPARPVGGDDQRDAFGRQRGDGIFPAARRRDRPRHRRGADRQPVRLRQADETLPHPAHARNPARAGYEEALAKWIEHFTAETQGRAFVLFTNYRMMQATAERTRPYFAAQGWPLLVQGEGMSRRRMVEAFKGENSVLFGTESFWSGVDVPGEALSNVIITQLPFAPPDSPATEARCELIRERGGDPFSEYSLPEAILKLRQGVGRLIRTKGDKGIVAILDSRVVKKPYGRAFLSALPKCPVAKVE